MSDRVWLRHPDTGGAFHCPAGAVPAWLELGWAPGDPPEETNPVVAELLAAQQAAASPETTAKTGRRGGTDTTTPKE